MPNVDFARKEFYSFYGACWGINGSRCFFIKQLNYPHDLLARMRWGTSRRISARVAVLPNQEEICTKSFTGAVIFMTALVALKQAPGIWCTKAPAEK